MERPCCREACDTLWRKIIQCITTTVRCFVGKIVAPGISVVPAARDFEPDVLIDDRVKMVFQNGAELFRTFVLHFSWFSMAVAASSLFGLHITPDARRTTGRVPSKEQMDYLVCGVPLAIGAIQIGDAFAAHRSTSDLDESATAARWRRKRTIDMSIACVLVAMTMALLVAVRLQWVAFAAMALPTFMLGFYVTTLLMPSGNEADAENACVLPAALRS